MSCGLAALRMLFAYFGDEVSEKEINSETPKHSFGNFLTELGTTTLKRGYNVDIISLHLSVFGPLKLPFGTQINKKHLSRLRIEPSDRMALKSIKEYLASGGKLTWDTPKISRMEQVLDKKLPCIISVNTVALGSFWRTWNNGHFLVIDGYTKNEISILDPCLPKEKAQYKIKKDILLPAWAINSTRSAAHLMYIKK